MLNRWFNAVLGAWLVVVALFASKGAEAVNNLLLGCGIFLIAFLAMGVRPLGRLNALLGAWAIASPFVLGYHDAAAGLSDVAVGVLVFASSLFFERRAEGHPESPAS